MVRSETLKNVSALKNLHVWWFIALTVEVGVDKVSFTVNIPLAVNIPLNIPPNISPNILPTITPNILPDFPPNI